MCAALDVCEHVKFSFFCVLLINNNLDHFKKMIANRIIGVTISKETKKRSLTERVVGSPEK